MTAGDQDVSGQGRLVERVVVKRNNPRFIDVHGHWWIEMDGVESYGWWPVRPVSLRDAVRGVPGVLNGVGGQDGGTGTVDPRHGEPADHAFHPVLLDDRTDDDVIDAARRFASTFSGGWRWSPRPTVNCRSFQSDLLAAAGLVVPDGYGHTGGVGCPFLASPRRWRRQLARRCPAGRPRLVARGALGAIVVGVGLLVSARGPNLTVSPRAVDLRWRR
ncbi:hypothetical protein [Iamia sp.]|uniref:hypothetical protein n=1 Tax=Iamia sp. TaxID=2722710 RepID=UPI002B91289B|nr:hypothetical protein [Iamia sp.]HXH56195.1 hypothetical protein [Iamia sp.]